MRTAHEVRVVCYLTDCRGIDGWHKERARDPIVRALRLCHSLVGIGRQCRWCFPWSAQREFVIPGGVAAFSLLPIGSPPPLRAFERFLYNGWRVTPSVLLATLLFITS